MRQRREKIDELSQLGVELYPHKYSPDHTSAGILEKFADAENEPDETQPVVISGRIMTRRDHGNSGFAHLQDSRGQIQIYVRQNNVGADTYDIYKKLDIGDFVGVCGTVFQTRTGEITVSASEVVLLSKSFRPLPEKFHGLQDKETRYRQRYADLIMNQEVKEVFINRSRIIQAIRDFLNNLDYLEVETPILQPVYGGANARPFMTHHNVLDIPLFLRIANELYLKRLIVGGFDRVYEFAKDFRNEGMDRDHNPEFTMIELYQAYADYRDMMDLTENMILHTVEAVFDKVEIRCQGTLISYALSWKRMTMIDSIHEVAGIDIETKSDRELIDILQELGEDIENNTSRGNLISDLFEVLVEPKLIQPTFIFDYPVEVSPLAKKKRGNEKFVERFELFINGMEIGNAFSELNDPVDQRKRFIEQAKKRELGDEEAFMMDEDYLRALEYGMPPTGGLGIGIDRLTMLLTDQGSIRDVILFPQMRPER
ncbi:TPA: lysine--tRNA ligase [Candidatus Poribacteria bacterium]|nr:lysine--tRNA ligase [Candidatus Poribacteria bacterium]HIB92456.1 lysine--tRNA ligase [Candidatus Poribacteria bacterium]HIC02519.1 lysine--tRNA ligase [Candidatus Poribacteria bacterium]HIC19776.1 lysine--tRNA ligase [Candidatus Poribacteria bacterium]HIN29661.1 lysine--tRNA ligase [Candidatus Poribacteria bacterium]